MTYRINKTDGNLLTEIPDGIFDTGSSSLSLIGKNVTNFGEVLNENLVKLLENFASSSPPENPLKGQVWYDTSTGRLNVYDGNDFRASGGPLISALIPTNLVPGDLWINSSTNQLWFYDGADLVLSGPLYTNQQGVSGFTVESIIDTTNRVRVIAKLWVKNILLGIFSTESFTPALPIDQFIGSIEVGFNASTLANSRFNITATRAESLITSLGEIKDSDDILYTNGNSSIVGSLTIVRSNAADALPFGIRLQGISQTALAPRGDAVLQIENGNFQIVNQEAERNTNFVVTSSLGGPITAITINGSTKKVGFFTSSPETDVDINGNLTVRGQLNIIGSSVTINTTDLAIEDKNLELNKVTGGANNSTLANGGGIILLAEPNNSKTILYNNSVQSWDFSEHVNLESNTLDYRITGDTVLTRTSLGNTVVSSNLQNLGQLTSVNMLNGLTIAGNSITATGNLVLSTQGPLSYIDANQKRITNLANLNYITSSPADAANKQYVDERVLTRPLSFSVDINAFPNTQLGNEQANGFILDILNNISPIFDPIQYSAGAAVPGSVAKIAALRTGITTFKRFIVAFIPNPDYPIEPGAPSSIPAWLYKTDFIFRGKWKSSLSYQVNDTVFYDAGSGFNEYICISATTPGQAPTLQAKWNLIDSI